MLTYRQSTGELFSNAGIKMGAGYAGHGVGRNNPNMQSVKDVGPLPRGFYGMKPPIQDGSLGPDVIVLVQDEENEMFGRSLFRMHGDSAVHPGKASCGCIVLSRGLRMAAWASDPSHRLQVVS